MQFSLNEIVESLRFPLYGQGIRLSQIDWLKRESSE
jgi:hypothetical protein